METVGAYAAFAVVGLVVGSFNNVVAYRVPAGESVVVPPSHCPVCATQLKASDLVPVLSFVVLGGRCRYCRAPIPFVYPLMEIATALLFVLAFWRFGWSGELGVALPLFALLTIVTHTDARLKRIPDAITIPGMVYFAFVRLLYHPLPWQDYVLGFFAAGGLLLLIAVTSRGGMGGGDIKLMALAGLALGWQQSLLAFALATLSGGVVGTFLLLTGKVDRKDTLAFGIFLAIGIVCAYVWGEQMWQSYWHDRLL